MTELSPVCSRLQKATDDFHNALAVFTDYFGGEMPAELAFVMLWPWEIEILRLFDGAHITEEVAVRSWARMSRVSAAIGRAASVAGIDLTAVYLQEAANVERRTA